MEKNKCFILCRPHGSTALKLKLPTLQLQASQIRYQALEVVSKLALNPNPADKCYPPSFIKYDKHQPCRSSSLLNRPRLLIIIEVVYIADPKTPEPVEANGLGVISGLLSAAGGEHWGGSSGHCFLGTNHTHKSY